MLAPGPFVAMNGLRCLARPYPDDLRQVQLYLLAERRQEFVARVENGCVFNELPTLLRANQETTRSCGFEARERILAMLLVVSMKGSVS